MPLSWFKIPRDTSEPMRRCRGNDMTDAKFEQCTKEIVANRGKVLQFRHVGRRFSQAKICWENQQAKREIAADLDATEIPDPESERGGDGPTAGPPG